MASILSVIHSKKWSWGFTLGRVAEILKHHNFVKVLWDPKLNVEPDLVEFFDITFMQNVDGIKCVKNKKKVVSRIGGFYMDEKNLSTRYDLELKQVAAVIATSEELYEVGKRVNENTFMIPNGVDLGLFKPNGNKDYDSKRPFIVGFVGNIRGVGRSYKGFSNYCQATSRLRPNVSTINLLFGDNMIPNDEMPKEFYHKIDCLVLPSTGEGCSNTITEALACGVPVICTKVGFHGERLKNEVNCLFVTQTVESIISGIECLMLCEKLRWKLAFEGRIFAEMNHDIKKIAEAYDNVFKLVLNKN